MVEWRHHYYEEVASTNDLALAALAEGTARSGDLHLAQRQTAGRGRDGREWHSTEGALLFTAVLPFHAGWTALGAGIAVARAARCLGVPAGVKWPNDVLVGREKLAGILCEARDSRLAAVGIGINVANKLPARLDRPAARLVDLAPGVTPEQVLPVVLEQLDLVWRLLDRGDLEALRREWDLLDAMRGRPVNWVDGGRRRHGVAGAPAWSGALSVSLPGGGECEIVAGELDWNWE